MDGQTDGWTKQMYVYCTGRMSVWIDKCMNAWMNE